MIRLHLTANWRCCLLAVLVIAGPGRASAQDPKTLDEIPSLKAVKERTSQIKARVETELPSLEQLYMHLHAHPELSYKEEQTSARLARELRDLGFEVTAKVGGHGIVSVLRNGDGPTVMIRTDMDGLPVVEKTGLPYASNVRTRDKDGKEVGVMHACGHDMHMTCWVGTARVLTGLKKQWKGTLIFIGQPAEEVGAGARMMLEDGLFKRFPRPDYCLGLHCNALLPHGHVSYSEGLLLANVDSVDITVRGRGGHGSAPHQTIDPIVIGARIVLDLQTLVSRENNPFDPVVVTVGAFHGGTVHNIIPSEAKLQLTVRTLKDDVRARVLQGIDRIAKAAAQAAKAPEPIVKLRDESYTPALTNTAPLARKTARLFREALGEANVHEQGPVLGGEDFSRYGLAGVPIFFYFLGTVPPERIAEAKKGGEPLPGLHSDLYYPTPAPTIRTGVLSMSLAALNLLGQEP
jgi:hippurate hydrolase